MAIGVEVAHKTRGPLYNNNALQAMYYVTLDNAYPSGGYDLDLKAYTGKRIDAVLCSDFGSYHPMYNTITKKLRITNGPEVPVGTSFYDAVNDQYAKFFIWAFTLDSYFDPKGIQPDVLIVPSSPDNRMLRKDADDSFQENVTTTVPVTSSLVIEGGQTIEVSASSEVKGELKIADGGVQTVQAGGTSTVESGGTQTINSGATSNIAGTQNIQSGATQTINSGGTVSLAPGATQNNAGNIISVSSGVFPAGTTQSVDGGTLFGVDGAITPNIDTLTGGTEGKTIVIQCVSGISDPTLTATIHQGPTIDLVADVDFVMKNLDVLSLKYEGGVWREPVGRVVKDGSSTVASGGTTTIASGGSTIASPGSTTTTSGTTITGNAIVFPAGVTNPSIAGGNLFVVNGAITSSLVNFMGGQNGVEFSLTCSLGPVVISHNPSYIVLKGKTNLTLQQFDSISFRMEDGIWVEQTSNIKNGWAPINDTGMVMVYTGGVVNNGGVEIKTPITAPVPITAGTLDASKNSQINIDPAVMPTITNIAGNGTVGQNVTIVIALGTAGTSTIYNNSNIQLSKGNEFAMIQGCNISLSLQANGVWLENHRFDVNSALTGAYTTFVWSTSVTLSPTTMDMLYTLVTSDGVVNFGNLPKGIRVVLGFRSDNIASHTISFGTNTEFPYSAIILQPVKIAVVSCYCDGVIWRISEPSISTTSQQMGT